MSEKLSACQTECLSQEGYLDHVEMLWAKEKAEADLALEKESNRNNCGNWELQCNDLKAELADMDKKIPQGSFCAECETINSRVDEDGLCVSCGNDSILYGWDWADLVYYFAMCAAQENTLLKAETSAVGSELLVLQKDCVSTKAELAGVKEQKTFPISPGAYPGIIPHPTRIPWEIADLAYSVYCSRYGRDQTLERIAERGGFGVGEMDIFLPDWRERCSKMMELQAERDRLQEINSNLRKDLLEKAELRIDANRFYRWASSFYGEIGKLLVLLERWRNTHPCGRDDYKCQICEDTDAALAGGSVQEPRCKSQYVYPEPEASELQSLTLENPDYWKKPSEQEPCCRHQWAPNDGEKGFICIHCGINMLRADDEPPTHDTFGNAKTDT